MVLLIALLHAVPVVLASLTGSRTITILVAVLSGIAGFLTGNPAYIAFDIGAVLLATFVTMPESSGSPGRWRAFFTGMFGDLVQVVVAFVVVVVLIGGGAIYYNRVHGPCADDKLRVKNQTFQQCRAVENAKTKRF